MPNYAPTIAPGDTRRRTRFIGIWTPLNGMPQVQVLEQDVVRLASGEVVLADLGNLPVGEFDPAESFPVKNPADDSDMGTTATVAEAMALIYSWVRHKQAQRDNTSSPDQPDA